MDLDKDILQKLQEYWPEKWEDIIQHYEKTEKLVNEKIPGRYNAKEEITKRVLQRERVIDFERETLKNIIPKDKLKDGVTYIAMEGTERLCRHIEEARWDEKEGLFWYIRTKFGHTFEDTMHHFADVINGNLAGFTPIKEKE